MCISPSLNGQPTEALIDAGCDTSFGSPGGAQLCVGLLFSSEDPETDFHGDALYSAAAIGVGNTGIALLNSSAHQHPCSGEAQGSIAEIFDVNTGESTSVDPSASEFQCEERPVG
jgi:hypothetical protein